MWYAFSQSGYGLVVKRVLAKDESGVRFSLSAPRGIKTVNNIFVRLLQYKIKVL